MTTRLNSNASTNSVGGFDPSDEEYDYPQYWDHTVNFSDNGVVDPVYEELSAAGED